MNAAPIFLAALIAALLTALLIVPRVPSETPITCEAGLVPFFNGTVWGCKPSTAASAGVPAGLIAFSETGGCPTGLGWKRVTGWEGRALVMATQGDANTLGGSATVTPVGSISAHIGPEVLVVPVATGTLGAIGLIIPGDHTFQGQPADNRPEFVRLTPCRKS